MFLDVEVIEMTQALEAGIKWANSLQVGDSFQGAMPEAQARFANLRSQRLFVYGAVGVLEKHVLRTAGDTLIITEYSPK